MNTKFNIGDRVSYISGVGGAETVFEIKLIMQDKYGFVYVNAATNDRIQEDHLTLYTEPKKKVNKYLWAYQYVSNHGGICRQSVTCNFYSDESEFKEDYSTGSMDFFKRLDFSATEFDVES